MPHVHGLLGDPLRSPHLLPVRAHLLLQVPSNGGAPTPRSRLLGPPRDPRPHGTVDPTILVPSLYLMHLLHPSWEAGHSEACRSELSAHAQVGGGGDYRLAVCPECDGAAGKVVGVGLLGTLTSKFEFQKQTLAELKRGAEEAAIASKFTGLVPKASSVR